MKIKLIVFVAITTLAGTNLFAMRSSAKLSRGFGNLYTTKKTVSRHLINHTVLNYKNSRPLTSSEKTQEFFCWSSREGRLALSLAGIYLWAKWGERKKSRERIKRIEKLRESYHSQYANKEVSLA